MRNLRMKKDLIHKTEVMGNKAEGNQRQNSHRIIRPKHLKAWLDPKKESKAIEIQVRIERLKNYFKIHKDLTVE